MSNKSKKTTTAFNDDPIPSHSKQKKKGKNGNKNDEEEHENTLQEFILFQMNKFFVEHIPVESVREISGMCKF
jgi:chemotaxis signal transduction protein